MNDLQFPPRKNHKEGICVDLKVLVNTAIAINVAYCMSQMDNYLRRDLSPNFVVIDIIFCLFFAIEMIKCYKFCRFLSISVPNFCFFGEIRTQFFQMALFRP